MAIKPLRIESKQHLRIPIPMKDVPDLHIETGTALVEFAAGQVGDWRRATVEFETDARWETYKQNYGNVPAPVAIATASLASISNDRTAVWAGWAVDGCSAIYNQETGKICVEIKIAVRDSDGRINRIQYTVVARGLLVNPWPAQF